jgi:hypothetical protein
MNPIRKLAVIGSAGAGVCTVIALALAPASVLAHDRSFSDSKPAAGAEFVFTAPPATPECQAAWQALTDWRVADRREDMEEKLAKQQPGYDPAADVAEDAQERATVKGLWEAIRAACAPQAAAAVTAVSPPSDACVAAKQAFKDAITAQAAREKAERANGTEGTAADAASDKQEAASLKALWDAKHAACGNGWQHAGFEQPKAAFASQPAAFGWHRDRR